MDIDPTTITVALVVDELKKNMSQDLADMIAVLEEHLVELVAHPANAGRPEFEVVGEALAAGSVMPLYGDGIEEQLTRPLTEKFGITGIANLAFGSETDKQKSALCYYICGARETLRLSEVKHVLQSQYGVTEQAKLEDLGETINHELRWAYNGDVKRFFEDLSAIEPNSDIADRISALSEKNHRERWDGTSTLPEPNMMG